MVSPFLDRAAVYCQGTVEVRRTEVHRHIVLIGIHDGHEGFLVYGQVVIFIEGGCDSPER